MEERLFGTDGVRGIANRELSGLLASRLAFSAARTLFAGSPRHEQVLIGHDTRISADMLEAALAAGFTAAGVNVLLAGVLPTPGIAYLTQALDCDMGVVISASHNPYEYNGIKIFTREGFKLPDAIEDQIAAGLAAYENAELPIGGEIGRISRLPDAAVRYGNHLRNLAGLDLQGLRIGLDMAHGAASAVAPELFGSLGAELVQLGNAPDGLNINRGVGSTHVESLCALVREQHLDLGLAFDGDADRLIAVDENGEAVDGDVMLAILAADLKAQGKLAEDTLVVTVMSNMGLDKMAARHGIHLVKTKVGDRYVLEEMLKNGYILGGEQSGHLIFLQDSTTGDGMLSALHLLAAMRRKGQSLAQLRQLITVYPQVLVNVPVANEKKAALMADPDIRNACARVEERLGERGRLLVRPSGTEPRIRVMLEGEDLDEITEEANRMAALMKSRFSL